MSDHCLLALPFQVGGEDQFRVLRLNIDPICFPSDLRKWTPTTGGPGSPMPGLDDPPDSVVEVREQGIYYPEELDDLVLEGYPPVYRWDGVRWRVASIDVKWPPL